MVQVIETGNPQGKIAEMLGMSLGQGLGNGINTYFANKALEDVVNDKSLSNAPISAKMGKIQSAMSPYGDIGKELFLNRFAIEQQAAQEQATTKQEANERIKGKAVGKYLKGEPLTDAEEALFSPKEMSDLFKAKNPKPAGGITAQPVSPEVSQKINQVLQESQKLNADQLRLKMDQEGIPPTYSNPYIENRRREDEAKSKTENKQAEIASKEDIQFHQESSKYQETLEKEAKVAKKQVEIINDIEKDVKENKIKPSNMANIFTFFGDTGKKISNALLSGEQAKLMSAIPEFLEGRKELFGVRLSDADLRLLQDKLPDINKSKEANLQILGLMKKYASRSMLKEQAADTVLEKEGIRSRSGKLRPLNYSSKVEKEFDRMVSEQENGVKMITPDGREITVPLNEVGEAEALNARRK